jgi:ribosomal protein S18 acetylase RimI-like enzyme
MNNEFSQLEDETRKFDIKIRWISHGSQEYEKSLNLREEVLRKPLGLRLEREVLNEENANLLTAWYRERCVGTMVMFKDDNETARMKAVAVDSQFQGRGIGKNMVEEFEKEACRLGLKKVSLHARKVVIEFYEKLGYEAVGEEFYEVTIPHKKMSKNLFS